MRPYASADFETDPFRVGVVPKVFAAGFFDGKGTSLFWEDYRIADAKARSLDVLRRWWKCAADWLRKNPDGLVYFHNGGNFDVHYIFGAIPATECEFLTIGKRIVQIKLPGGGEIRDSFAIMPRALKEWGKGKISYLKFRAHVRRGYKDAILRYLSRDLSELFAMLTGFFERYGQELTLASASFKKLQESTGEKFPKGNRNFDSRFRPFYFGGRVEFWQIGRLPGRWHALDINSAFADSMLHPHWWGATCKVSDKMPKKPRRKGEPGPEHSFYDVTCTSRGALPLRGKQGLEFPRGRHRFLCSGWELTTALRLGLVSSVVYHFVYSPHTVKQFGEYVRPLYKMKESADNPEDRYFAKMGLCQPYGKFGINPENFRVVRCTAYGPPLLKKPWKLGRDDLENGLTFWSRPARTGRDAKQAKRQGDKPDRPAHYNNVATGASITGKARAFLLEAIHLAKGAAYCDTDSLFIPDKALRKFSVGPELGQWKHDFVFSKLWIGGRKLYVGYGHKPGDKKRTWKSASKGARLSPGRLVRVCEGQAQRMTFQAPSFSVFSGVKFTTREIKRSELK